MARKIKLSELVVRERLSPRGGGIEINLTRKGFKDQYMTAYQNYLGGGMLGCIQNDCTLTGWKDIPKLQKVAEELSRYMYDLMCEYADMEDYERIQNYPASAY